MEHDWFPVEVQVKVPILLDSRTGVVVLKNCVLWVCKNCGRAVQAEVGQVPPKPGCPADLPTQTQTQSAPPTHLEKPKKRKREGSYF